MVYRISFDASPRQLSKIRNGHSVRIKKGTGFNLVVHPENYKLVSRAFTKDKGVELRLTPEELQANQELSPEQAAELGMEGGSIFKKIGKAFQSKTAKKIGRVLRPISRVAKKVGREMLHEQIADAHQAAASEYGDDPRIAQFLKVGSKIAHEQIGNGISSSIGNHVRGLSGMGMGAGMYAGRGMNAHDALKLANLATAQANSQIAKYHNATVHGQLSQPPIKRYWDESTAPPSRGTGVSNHYNMIRGRGSMLSQDDIMPPALQSQPYGANFHFQFQLPPQYHKYNDGTDVEGRGMYM